MANLQEEIWKDVVGYESNYQVSNLDAVKSVCRPCRYGRGGIKTIPERIMKTRKDRYGYEQIKLLLNGKARQTTVHRVVAMAFHSNPARLPQINHKDGNKLNNYANNLEWVTCAQNVQHSIEIGIKGVRSGPLSYRVEQPLRRKPVNQLDLTGNLIKEWPGGSFAAKELGLRQTHITRCCKGLATQYKGYKWQWHLPGL